MHQQAGLGGRIEIPSFNLCIFGSFVWIRMVETFSPPQPGGSSHFAVIVMLAVAVREPPFYPYPSFCLEVGEIRVL